MPKYLFIFIILIVSDYFPQDFEQLYIFNTPTISGTFIIAAICKNGIVVGADSRTVFYDNHRKIAAYFEGKPKIYQHQNILVAMAGLYTFDKIDFSDFFNKFSVSHKPNIRVSNFFPTFTKYMRSQLSKNEYEELLKNQFLICGYSANKPIIHFYNGQEKKSIFLKSQYAINYEKDNNLSQINEFLKNADVNKTLTFVEVLIEGVIKHRNKDTVSSIGGIVTLAYINLEGVKWIQKQNIDD